MAVTVNTFLGTNNKEAPEALMSIDKGRAKTFMPSGVNVDVTDAYKLRRRFGVTRLLTGNWHSLWAHVSGSYGFGVKDGAVYRLYPRGDNVAATAVGLSVSSRRMVFSDVSSGDVHFSDGQRHWVYSGGAVEELTQAGTYDRTEQFADQDEDAAFYDAFPPVFELTWAFGRLWGADADAVWYSPAFFPRRCKADTDYIAQPGVTLLKAVSDGVYVGTEEAVWFYAGTDPKKMRPTQVCGEGAVKGTPVAVTADKFKIDGAFGPAVVWESVRGKVLGLSGGRIVYLTDAAVSYAPGELGASLLREANGLTQHLSAFPATSERASNMRATDVAEATIVRNGTII